MDRSSCLAEGGVATTADAGSIVAFGTADFGFVASTRAGDTAPSKFELCEAESGSICARTPFGLGPLFPTLRGL